MRESPVGEKENKMEQNEIEIDLKYTPQPKQLLLHQSPANEILYGGAAGPGPRLLLCEK